MGAIPIRYSLSCPLNPAMRGWLDSHAPGWQLAEDDQSIDFPDCGQLEPFLMAFVPDYDRPAGVYW